MTIDELRKEAKNLGYKLVKDEYIKRKPCPRCGSKKVPSRSYYPNYGLICRDCGFTTKSVPRRRHTIESIKMWNEGIEENET